MKLLIQYLFSIDLEQSRRDIHPEVINMLKRYYENNNFKVFKEYPVPSNDDGRNLYIDLFAWKPNLSIGIEYDNGIRIKKRSAKKLSTLSPLTSIFIVRRGNIYQNSDRLLEIVQSSASEKIYFISLKLKKIVEIR